MISQCIRLCGDPDFRYVVTDCSHVPPGNLSHIGRSHNFTFFVMNLNRLWDRLSSDTSTTSSLPAKQLLSLTTDYSKFILRKVSRFDKHFRLVSRFKINFHFCVHLRLFFKFEHLVVSTGNDKTTSQFVAKT